jgi:hypothetical protein
MLRPVAEIACVNSRGTPSWKRLCQDALRDVVVPCTSAIRALLAFTFGHDPDPRITFPYLLKICASKRGLCAAPAGSSTPTTSLDVPPSSSASAF